MSFPRVRRFAEEYEAKGGPGSFQVLQVTEQAIMDSMLLANRHGHIACTQGGECLAGLRRALELGLLKPGESAVLDATAHALKFIDFQDMYFSDSFPPEYGITPNPEYVNRPEPVLSQADKDGRSPGEFTLAAVLAVAEKLGLEKK